MNILESKTIRFRTISPIHIKGKNIEYGQGFVQRDELSAYSIDSGKLAEFLFEFTQDLTLVEKYINEIEKLALRNKIKEFDNEKFLADAKIYHHKYNRSHEQQLIQQGVFKSIVNATPESRFVRDGLGRPFIPGSSIKGVLRTAVMYYMAKHFLKVQDRNTVKTFLENFDAEVEEFRRRTKDKDKRQIDLAKKYFSQKIQQFIFQNKTIGTNTKLDFFRCVKVKDSKSLSEVKRGKAVLLSLKTPKKQTVKQTKPVVPDDVIGTIIAIGEGIFVDVEGTQYDFTNKVYIKHIDRLKANVGKGIRILNAQGNKIKEFEILDIIMSVPEDKEPNKGETFKYPIQIKKNKNDDAVDFDIETFSGTSEFTITLDHSILSDLRKKNRDIPFSSIDELFQLLFYFNNDLWDQEKKFFEHCTDDQLNISETREFYQTQYNPRKMRIGWGTGLLGMTVDMLFTEKQLKNLRNIMFTDREDFPAPKSKRLTYNENEPMLPLGWIELLQ